jgi:molybdopterin molybdotransferase
MFLSNLIPVPDAKKIIRDNVHTIPMEEIHLEESYQRVLAQDITSSLDSPPFDRSAMDGYAILAEDTFGHSETNPAQLKVVDRIGAGEVSSVKIGKGEAIQIATGAPIPGGADAVVMEEYTQGDGEHLRVEMALTPGENVSPAGEDFKKGEQVLNSRKLLNHPELAMIASSGFNQISVFKKPRIGVIITGSELVMPKKSLNGAEVINSNHYTVKSLVERSLGVPEMSHCIDNEDMVESQFKSMLKDCDALVTTGGTAISKGDVVVDVAHKLGDVLIHGVTLRPGKPFAFALIRGKPVFMLSGFPVAAMVQFDVFVREGLLQMQGLDIKPLKIVGKASRKIPSTLGRTDYIRARIKGQMVQPLKIKGSGIIKSMVESDCYLIIPENLEGVDEGAECEILPYHSLKV